MGCNKVTNCFLRCSRLVKLNAILKGSEHCGDMGREREREGRASCIPSSCRHGLGIFWIRFSRSRLLPLTPISFQPSFDRYLNESMHFESFSSLSAACVMAEGRLTRLSRSSAALVSVCGGS